MWIIKSGVLYTLEIKTNTVVIITLIYGTPIKNMAYGKVRIIQKYLFRILNAPKKFKKL